MRVFMTGGTGFIGTHIVHALLEAGDRVTVFARDPATMTSALSARVDVVRGELDRIDAIRDALRGHDACVHNAICWRDVDEEIGLDDIRAATNVFHAAADEKVEQLVYTSSTAVHKPYAPRMDENVRLAPVEFYGATKATNEAFLAAFSWQTSMRCNVIRPGPTVGGPFAPGARVINYRTIADIAARARRGEDIRVKERDGRQFIAVRDLATLYARVIHAGVNRETYLGVAHDVITWEEIARTAVQLAGSSSRIIVEKNTDPGFFWDAAKIERDFGLSFTARATIEEDLRRLLSR